MKEEMEINRTVLTFHVSKMVFLLYFYTCVTLLNEKNDDGYLFFLADMTLVRARAHYLVLGKSRSRSRPRLRI